MCIFIEVPQNSYSCDKDCSNPLFQPILSPAWWSFFIFCIANILVARSWRKLLTSNHQLISSYTHLMSSSVCWSVMADIAKYHWLGGLNNRNLFLTILEGGSPRSSFWPILFLIRAIFLSCRWLPSCRLEREPDESEHVRVLVSLLVRLLI